MLGVTPQERSVSLSLPDAGPARSEDTNGHRLRERGTVTLAPDRARQQHESRLRVELPLPARTGAGGSTSPSDTAWLGRLARRLFLLDLVLLSLAMTVALRVRFGAELGSRRSRPTGTGCRSPPTSCSGRSWSPPGCWCSTARAPTTPGCSGSAARSTAGSCAASVYFWGLVAIASYMAQFELSRFLFALAFLSARSCCCSAAGPARKVLHRARPLGPATGRTGCSPSAGVEEVDALVAELEREPYAGLQGRRRLHAPRRRRRRILRARWSAR